MKAKEMVYKPVKERKKRRMMMIMGRLVITLAIDMTKKKN